MYRQYHWPDESAADKVAERQTAGLVGIVIILLLLIGGLFLVHRLHSATVIEDCMLAGRHDCDSLVQPRN